MLVDSATCTCVMLFVETFESGQKRLMTSANDGFVCVQMKDGNEIINDFVDIQTTPDNADAAKR